MRRHVAASEAVALGTWDGAALWLCPLHDWPSTVRQEWLGSDERIRASRLRFDAHRRRYLAAHAWLRLLLGAWLGAPPASLGFSADPNGKPRLRQHPAHFNLSHSGDWALIGACSDAEIGVDIEVLRPVDDAAALARRHYTDGERAACEGNDPAAARAFLEVWTRKEACLKAVGTGLRASLSALDTGLPTTVTSLATLAAPGGIRSIELRSVDTGVEAVAAVARVTA